MIRVDKLSTGGVKTVIDTGTGGASPFTWAGLDLTKAPWLEFHEGGSNFALNPTAGGLVFQNVATGVGTVLVGYTGITPTGFFRTDSGGFLALSLHFDNFVQALDVADQEFNGAFIGMTTRGQLMHDLNGNWCGEGAYGIKAAAGASLDGKLYLVLPAGNRTAEWTHSLATVDEFEIQIQIRPAGLGAPQSGTILWTGMDWINVKRWIAGVPQADETNGRNRTSAGDFENQLVSWTGYHLFFGIMQNVTSMVETARLTFIRLDRGRFYSYN